jgi:hypothetical protein
MATMYFKSQEHRERFLAALLALGKIYNDKIDQEYGAALYILTADHAIWQKAQPYIERHAIDIEAMLAEIDLSHGYEILVKLAGNLFNGEQHLDPLDFIILDERNFAVALTALQIRRSSLSLQVLEEKSDSKNYE